MKTILSFVAVLFTASVLFSCRPHVLCPAYSSAGAHKTESVAVAKKAAEQKAAEKMG